MNLSRLPKPWLYAVAAAAILILLGNRGFRTVIRHTLQIRRLTRSLRELKKEEIQLRQEIGLAQNDFAYIERLARKELGLIQPGEIVYQFSPPQPSSQSRNPETGNKIPAFSRSSQGP